MKKGAERGSRIKTIREHLKEIGMFALESEVNASRNGEYDIASIHQKYVAAIEKAIGVCDSFLLFKEEIKQTGG